MVKNDSMSARDEGGEEKKLVVIPAYDEEKNIVGQYLEVRKTAPSYDVLVINDGSRDTTLRRCEEEGIPVLNLEVNRGIGGAIQAGFCFALAHGYGIVARVDGDGQHDPAYLEAMHETLMRENADLVIGSRFLKKEGYQSTALRRCGIRFFSRLIRRMTGQTVTDPTSGFFMLRGDLLRTFALDYPQEYPEPESIIRAIQQGRKIVETPVRMRERSGGSSSIGPAASVHYMIRVTVAMIRADRREQA